MNRRSLFQAVGAGVVAAALPTQAEAEVPDWLPGPFKKVGDEFWAPRIEAAERLGFKAESLFVVMTTCYTIDRTGESHRIGVRAVRNARLDKHYFEIRLPDHDPAWIADFEKRNRLLSLVFLSPAILRHAEQDPEALQSPSDGVLLFVPRSEVKHG